MTKAEEGFLEQMTRSLLPVWGDYLIKNPEGSLEQKPEEAPYWNLASERGWITKKEPYRLTAKGFDTASAFLKR